MSTSMIEGVIVIDKPQDMTSFDVVAIMRRTLKIKKIGHTGTLDPMATGVLPICVGNATKIVDFIMDKRKTYDCTMRLGSSTDTGDQWGTTTDTMPVPEMTMDKIKNILLSFVGDIQQVPPMYSALKINGQKLVDLARKGIEVERRPRSITIYKIEILSIDGNDIRFIAQCSKGTYIRTLCEDMGKALGTLAHMTALRRTASEPFTLEHAVSIEGISPEIVSEHLVPVDRAIIHFPAIFLTMSGEPLRQIQNGVRFKITDFIDSAYKRDPLGMNLFDGEKIITSYQAFLDDSSLYYRVYVNGQFFGIGDKQNQKLIVKKRFD